MVTVLHRHIMKNLSMKWNIFNYLIIVLFYYLSVNSLNQIYFWIKTFDEWLHLFFHVKFWLNTFCVLLSKFKNALNSDDIFGCSLAEWLFHSSLQQLFVLFFCTLNGLWIHWCRHKINDNVCFLYTYFFVTMPISWLILLKLNVKSPLVSFYNFIQKPKKLFVWSNTSHLQNNSKRTYQTEQTRYLLLGSWSEIIRKRLYGNGRTYFWENAFTNSHQFLWIFANSTLNLITNELKLETFIKAIGIARQAKNCIFSSMTNA